MTSGYIKSSPPEPDGLLGYGTRSESRDSCQGLLINIIVHLLRATI